MILLAFLIVGLFGLLHFTMDMNNDGGASMCPFMNIAALCAMNPLTHITMWQNIFIASFPKEIFSLLAIILLTVLLVFTLRSFWHSSKTPPIFVRVLRRISQIFIARNALQEAFSNGILHPKIF